MPDLDYKLYGFLMSPYSMKMRAYLRYRRIPFQWITGKQANDIAHTRVDTYMVPVLENPEGEFANDSTYLIDGLEQEFSERRTEPDNEADAFLAFMVEDFSDEWLISPFFMHRWNLERDQAHNSRWILYEFFDGKVDNDQFDSAADGWTQRQTGLVRAVTGLPETYDLVDESLHAFLSIMERAVKSGLFFFGSRPSRAEFAIYGRLSQLLQDLTPTEFMRERYMFVSRWIGMMEDLSGVAGDWQAVSPDAQTLMSSPIAEILRLSSKYHLPMLKANLDALNTGSDSYSFEIEGRTYHREVHPRFAPCLPALQQRYSALSAEAKRALHDLLDESECLEYLV